MSWRATCRPSRSGARSWSLSCGDVPGAGSDARIQAGAKWASFSGPAVNASGQVAFLGRWKAPASTTPQLPVQSGTGIFLDGTLLAGCRTAGFTPRIAHTPSVISTVLRYVEAGGGLGIVPETVGEIEQSPRWHQIPLTPPATVPLVMVWQNDSLEPAITLFCELMKEWQRKGRLWE